VKAIGSSLGAWRQIEDQEGVRSRHGLTFSLATVAAIGEPYGLSLVAEEDMPGGFTDGFDAIFISVLDSRCMLNAASSFAFLGVPMRRSERGKRSPLVWAGGQGLHNPMPFAPIADLIVVGDAEDPLPRLLQEWDRHGNSAAFLSAASTIPGVFIPSLHDPTEARIVQSVSSDIAVSLLHVIDISLDGSRRVEIARGCRSKCSFCSLGWRSPYRENSAESVIATLHKSGHRRVHLQAGDAEGHSEISAIRAHLRNTGSRDLGWTGRLDSVTQGEVAGIEGGKRYAFGIEGVSYRLRHAVGKPRLTDEALIDDTARVLDAIEGESKGRTAWHVIAGLPTERRDEVLDLMRVVEAIFDRRVGMPPRQLSIHWQPFQPLPGTPSQWFGSGGGAKRGAAMLRGLSRNPWVSLHQCTGRTDDMARVCTILARSDARGADLIEAAQTCLVSPDVAERITGSTSGELDPDAPLPWDFVVHHYGRDVLRRAYAAMNRRLGQAKLPQARAVAPKSASGERRSMVILTHPSERSESPQDASGALPAILTRSRSRSPSLARALEPAPCSYQYPEVRSTTALPGAGEKTKR
jgi:hypothetical protein